MSHVLDDYTPSYGNRDRLQIEKKSDIEKGDVANNTHIKTTVHIGTHIDLPYHFYKDGQSILDFKDDFWIFDSPLFLEIEPKSLIIKDEIIEKLEKLEDKNFDILIVKTGIEKYRNEDIFWKKNYGFAPDLYDYLINKFSNLRVFGFDTISVSSYKDRTLGREAHRRFLNPQKPILLLEDMKLQSINTQINKIIIAPLRIKNCDGLPCSVMGFE
jgi:kynurenine formamidase